MAPRILCPYCGSHATKIETRRLAYSLWGSIFGILTGLCYGFGEICKSAALERLLFAGMFLFGAVAAVFVWFEVSPRTKWLVCASCRRTSKIDPKTARWWTAEPADCESPEQEEGEVVEEPAGV